MSGKRTGDNMENKLTVMSNIQEEYKEEQLMDQFFKEAKYCNKMGGFYYITIPGKPKSLRSKDTRKLFLKWKKEMEKI